MDWWSAFFDEMEKISAEDIPLNPSERRREALQFAGLGAVTVPALSAVSNKIMHGQITPKGVPFKRWLPASVAGGLFWGGLMPALRHGLARSNAQQARYRYEAEKELKQLGTRKVQSVISKAPTARLVGAPLHVTPKLIPKLLPGGQ